MSDNKVKDVLAWNSPRFIHQVPQFLRFANFYCRFIQSCSAICARITQLTKEGQVRNWTTEGQEAFEHLKKCFLEALILLNYYSNKPFMIETNALDLAKGAVLSWYEKGDQKWHPVAFYNKKFSFAKLNCDIRDKEIFVIFHSVCSWCHILACCTRRALVYTNYRTLKHFLHTKILNGRQASWAELLAAFNCIITYRLWGKNGKRNPLLHRTDPTLEWRDMS